MQYIPCNSALLAQETPFLTQKGTFFCPKISKKCVNLNLRQNSVCSGLKFLSESKLFGRGPPCPRTTSATLLPHLLFFSLLFSSKWRAAYSHYLTYRCTFCISDQHSKKLFVKLVNICTSKLSSLKRSKKRGSLGK